MRKIGARQPCARGTALTRRVHARQVVGAARAAALANPLGDFAYANMNLSCFLTHASLCHI